MKITKQRYKYKIKLEENKLMKSALGDFFRLIFKHEEETVRTACKVLLALRKEREGFLVHGSQKRLIDNCTVSPPTYYKVVRILEDLGFIERYSRNSPVIEKRKYDEDGTPMIREKKYSTKYMRIANEPYFSRWLNAVIGIWVRIRTHPLLLEKKLKKKLLEED